MAERAGVSGSGKFVRCNHGWPNPNPRTVGIVFHMDHRCARALEHDVVHRCKVCGEEAAR